MFGSEMIGKNLESLAHAEIEKVEDKLKAIDADHDGIADLAEAKQLISSGSAKVQKFVSKIPVSDLVKLAQTLFPGVHTADEIKEAEEGVSEIIDGATHVLHVAEAAGVKL